MAISSYEENGIMLWKFYINLRSKTDFTVRVQRRLKGFKSREEAESAEKKALIELAKQVEKLENRGLRWEVIIDKWEQDKESNTLERYASTTIQDYAAMLRTWTRQWFGKSAQELNRGDGRELLKFVLAAGKSAVFVRRLRNVINQVYVWGIEERMIQGVHYSPVYGIDVAKDKEDKVPEILTLDETKALLDRAKITKHPWYSSWAVAVLTGMRSGELYALEWSDIEMVSEVEAKAQDHAPQGSRNYGVIRVVHNYNSRFRSFGPTKGGYWRTVPINSELCWLLADLKKKSTDKFVLPRSWEWSKGEQASILRKFCFDQGLKSIKFHTLRACFATQLISSGVPPTKVMKICGWKDLKTMQRYIRMAGIDEKGATDSLKFGIFTYEEGEEEELRKVIDLIGFRSREK